MLRSLKDLEGYRLDALDGDIGKAYDFYFDDESWVIRYLVADTGNWLPGRKVLLSPESVEEANWSNRSLRISLTKQQIKESPDIDEDQPVSRQHETELRAYYGWPVYWTAAGAYAGGIPPEPAVHPASTTTKTQTGDPHLRGVREIKGYGIHAKDGDIGSVNDVIAEDEGWHVRYLVVNTRKWLPGRQVLIAPAWLVGSIDWPSRKVTVNMTKEEIRQSPEYDPSLPVNRQYETILYDYYGRPGYWL